MGIHSVSVNLAYGHEHAIRRRMFDVRDHHHHRGRRRRPTCLPHTHTHQVKHER